MDLGANMIHAIRQEALIDECVKLLRELPYVDRVMSETCVQDGRTFVDRVVSMEVRGRAVKLFIETKASGFPRDALRAATRLEQVTRSDNDEAVGFFIAPSITPSARAFLKEKSIGYWDKSGSLYLNLNAAYFDIERPYETAVRSLPKNVFAGQAAQVVHTLLIHPDRNWSIKDLADHAMVAPSHGHQVMTALEERGIVEKSGKGPQTRRRLTDPATLLDEWAASSSLAGYAIEHYFMWAGEGRVSSRVAAILEEKGVQYALTATSGALHRAPFVWQESEATILAQNRRDLRVDLAASGMHSVDDGANIVILLTDRQSPFQYRNRVDGLWVASDIQIYLDLMHWPQRGKEQAAHLRQARIGF
jgi:hypothetical protein